VTGVQTCALPICGFVVDPSGCRHSDQSPSSLQDGMRRLPVTNGRNVGVGRSSPGKTKGVLQAWPERRFESVFPEAADGRCDGDLGFGPLAFKINLRRNAIDLLIFQ